MKRLSFSKQFRRETEAAIALDPKHIKARLFMISYPAGAPGIAGGDKEKAAEMVGKIASIDPAWGYVARARLVEELQPMTDRKAIAEREGLYKKAVAAATTPEVRGEALMSLANLYLSPSSGNFDLAEQQAREAAKIDPPRWSTWSSSSSAARRNFKLAIYVQ